MLKSVSMNIKGHSAYRQVMHEALEEGEFSPLVFC